MEQDIVDDLLKRPFARRSMKEKMLIARMDVPRPKLDNLKTTCKRNSKIITRNFAENGQVEIVGCVMLEEIAREVEHFEEIAIGVNSTLLLRKR